MPKERDTFDAVLLAGGRSTRMGSPKGMLLFKGIPWIRHQANELVRCGARRIVIVVGEHSDVYRGALVGTPENVQIVFNPDWDSSPFISLQLALAALCEDRGPWVWVQPLDTVVPDELTAAVLRQQCRDAPDGVTVVRPSWQGRHGHPVLLRTDFCETLLQLPATEKSARLDVQIRRLGEDGVLNVPVDAQEVLFDFNLPEQWVFFTKGD